jgi:hypothetical protein
MVDSTTVVEGFKQATAPGDVDSLESQALFSWGLRKGVEYITDMVNTVNCQQIEAGNQWYPTNVAGNAPADKVTVSFHPTNGIPFYALYGKATHTTADTKQTITNLDSGRKPRYKCAETLGALSPHVVHGVVFHDGSFRWEKGGFLSLNMTGKGQKWEKVAYALSTPTMPTHASNSYPSDAFTVQDYFSWNSSNLVSSIMTEMKVSQTLATSMGSSGYYDAISDSSPIFTLFNIIYRTAESGVWDDFHAHTKRTLVWKMSKSASSTHYFTVTAANSLIVNCIPIKNFGEVIGFSAQILCENPTIVCQDYVDDDRFAIPA